VDTWQIEGWRVKLGQRPGETDEEKLDCRAEECH